MGEVVDMVAAKEERTAHVSGEAFCLGCNHEWVGVWPVGVVELECPSCGSMKGRGKFSIGPPEGSKLWMCNCNNQLFNLLPDGVHCPNCGVKTSYAALVE